MKNLSTLLVLAGVLTTGCADDDDLTKGVVDVAALTQSGAPPVVTISGQQGTLTVPFSTPVPAVPANSFEDELSGAVLLEVHSPRTGNNASLTEGIISENPSAAGEFSWTLNAARDQATLTFFNTTPTEGLTLKPGLAYNVGLSVGVNDYVQRVPSTLFVVQVQ